MKKSNLLINITFNLLLAICTINMSSAQTFPMVVEITTLNASCAGASTPLGLRCVPFYSSMSTIAFNSEISPTDLISLSPLRLVAKSGIFPGSQSTPGPSNGISVYRYYYVDIPGTATSGAQTGYIAAGNTFSDPVCGALYLTVNSSVVPQNIRPAAGDLINHIYIGGILTNYALAFPDQNYAVTDFALDALGIAWYRIDLPNKPVGPSFTQCFPKNFCSSPHGWIRSSVVTLHNAGSIGLPPPTSVSVSSITATSATITWSEDYYPYNAIFTIKDLISGVTLGTVSNVSCDTITRVTQTVLVSSCTNYNIVVIASLPFGSCSPSTSSSPVSFSTSAPSTPPSFISASSLSICPGNSTTLTVVGGALGTGANWQWFSGSCGGLLIGTGPSITVSPATTTTYYVRATGTCNTTSCASVTISINANSIAPTSITTSPGTICSGESTTLSIVGGSLGGGASWVWYNGSCGGSTIGSGNSITVSPGGTSTYYARAEGPCNTTLCASTTVAVNPLPTVIASGGGTYCNNATITATGSGGTVYFEGLISGNTSTASPTTSQTVTSSGTYFFRARSATGCWGPEESVTVTINTPPSPISGPTNLCPGSTITLTDPTAGGTWNSSNTSIATIDVTSGILSGLSGGSTAISYTTSCGLATRIVTVNPGPTVIGGSYNVCVGMTTALSNAASGGTWASSNTLVGDISSTGVVSGLSSGTTIISYTLSTGCFTSAVITVNPLPSTIPGTSICVGANVALTNSVTGGSWSSGTPLVASVGSSTGIVTGIGIGTTMITYTVGAGCFTTTIVTVNAIPAPISGIFQVCEGLSTTLSDPTPGGTWSSNSASIATIGSASGIVSGITPGTTTISYTIATGCYRTASITVNTQPASISGNTNICVGSTTTLDDAVTGGSWSSGSPTIAAIALTTGVANGLIAGTAIITYTTGPGCISTTAITVNSLPLPITGTFNVCEGLSTILTDLTSGGSWSSNNTSIATVGSGTGVASGVAHGTTSISYILSTGCYTTTTITVNQLPTTINGINNVCVGSTTTLSDAITGGTWSSSSAGIATIGLTSGIVNGIGPGTVTITYSVGSGCYSAAIITVNPIPYPITGLTNVCEGSTITLSSSITGGTWSSNNTSVAAVGPGSGIVTGITQGIATIAYLLSTGCKSTINISVFKFPVIAEITGLSSVCVGSAITLHDAISGGFWIRSNDHATVTGTGGIVTGVSMGIDTISYVMTNVCGSADTSISITINPLPYAGVISGPSTMCIIPGITLTENVSGGIWSMSNGHATVSSAGGITGISAGMDTCIYSVSNICGVAIAKKSITIDTIPYAGVITGPNSVCVSSNIMLNDVTPGGVWSSSNSNATITAGVVTGIAIGNDTISYTIANTCGSDIATHYVEIDPFLTAGIISHSKSVCVGDIDTLIGVPDGGVWSCSNSSAAIVISGVTGSYAGIDTITYTVANVGCIANAKFVVTINPLPNAGKIICGDSLCVGMTDSISDTSPLGKWKTTNSNAIISEKSIIGIYRGIDTIFYSVINSCGTDTSVKIVIVNDLPNAGMINGPTDLCVANSISLSDSVTGGIWLSANKAASILSGNVTGLAAGLGQIFYIVNNNCGLDSASHSIIVHPISPVVITRIKNTLYVPAIFSSYQWTLNGNNISGATQSTYTPSTTGEYGISVPDMYGCYSSSSIDVSKIDCDIEDITVYPNPSEQTVYIRYCYPVNIKLYCMDGKFVKLVDNANQINIGELPNGSYILSLFDMDGNKIKTVEIAKLEK